MYETEFYRSHGQHLQYLPPCWPWTRTEPNFRPARNRILQISRGTLEVFTSLLAWTCNQILDLHETELYRSHRQPLQYLPPCWLWTCTEPNFRPARNRILQISRGTLEVFTSLLAWTCNQILDLHETELYRSHRQPLQYLPPCWPWTCTEPNFRPERN